MNISKRSKQLYDELSKGYNTWDIQSVTAHVLLPERIRFNVSFFIPHLNLYTSDNLWDQVEQFGEHTVDGSYTEVFIKFRGGIYRVESSACGDELLLKITPTQKRYNIYVALEAGEMFSQSCSFGYEEGNVKVQNDEKIFVAKSLAKTDKPDWDPITAPHICAKADEALYFTVNSEKTAAEIDDQLEKAYSEWMQSTITADGDLGEGLAAMRRSLLWNMVYDFKNERVITPVSRNWCKRRGDFEKYIFGDYVLFGWDTFFAGLQYGLIDKRLAYSSIFSMLEEETPEGMIPNFGCGNGQTRDRSEPQVGAMCVWKLYVQYGDKWFVEECFESLMRWNRWRFKERDFNGDGLLELASTPWEYEATDEIWCNIECGERIGAMWESGIDNSTMWDEAVFNEEYHCLELSYVGLNSLMAIDCELLEKMAVLLGRDEERKELHERRRILIEKIDNELWDESKRCYMNKNWDGTFDPCLSLTHFYTITAGIPNEKRLECLLNEHLLNEEEFWGEYVIPNISRNDKSFEDQAYWRGRIWAPTNFIVGEGLMRNSNMQIWDQLISKGLYQFIKCWKERGVVGENYNAINGEAAEPGKASDRFYHWGALLVYMAVERVVNFNEWTDKTEINEKPDWIEYIHNIPVKDTKIDI